MQKSETKGTIASEVEKATSICHVDDALCDSTRKDVDDDNHGFTESEQRDIVRRLDRRLVVTVGIMYCVSFMDRTNMSVANIAGMGQDLNLVGNKYVSLLTALPSLP